MSDTRSVGQELQDHVLAAARKGQQRVTSAVKNVTATAQLIRPQLPGFPTVDLGALPTAHELREKAPELIAKLPTPEQLREKAPAITVKLPSVHELREKAPGLIAKLPTPDQLREMAPGLLAKLPTAEQLRAGAEEFTADVIAFQRQVLGHLRGVTATHPSTAVKAGPAASDTGGVTHAEPAGHAAPAAHAEPASHAEPGSHGPHARSHSHAEPAVRPATAKPVPVKPARSVPRRTPAGSKKAAK